LYHVEDGRLIDVTGDPDHPMTRGGLCVKLNNYADHHYNPDRLLHPLRRVGPKGSGQFEQISAGPTSSTSTVPRRSSITATWAIKAR
jgi:anaerobic selenocysteine-containing dehydrogenase